MHKVLFAPADTNYKPVTFDVEVTLSTIKPLLVSVQVTPTINGAKLKVIATADSPLTYQWQVKGSWIDIPGATSPDFDYTGLLGNKEYTVRVIVTDANGNSITSEPISFKTSKQAVSGLPKSCTLENGKSISFTPSPTDGTWEYDKDYLSMSDKDGTVTFTAKKTGKTTASYTVNGTKQVVNFTITGDADSKTNVKNSATTTPTTGDNNMLGVYLTLFVAGLGGIIGIVVLNKNRKSSSWKNKD